METKRYGWAGGLVRFFGRVRTAWLQFRIGIARRRNARLAIDTLETRTQLLHSPLQNYNINQLKKLAARHKRAGRPQVAEGCKAEIKRRVYVGQHRDEIFLSRKGAKVAKVAVALLAICIAVSARADEAQSAIIPNVLWSTSGQWLIGLAGIMVIGYYALGTISMWRKLFGKKKNDDEVAGVRRQLYAVESNLEKADAKLRDEVNERFRELQIERAHTLSELNEKIGHVAEDCAFIRGKMSSEA